jgi:outer membrane lipopolysaccharide assembly protein LptE/RlpB
MRHAWCGLILLGLTGCYGFSGSSLPTHVKTLSLPVLENRTLEVAVNDELTQALTEKFVQDNRLRVVQRDSDAVLTGAVTGYQERVFGFNSDQQANEYLVVLTVDMALRDRIRNKDIWKEEGLRGTGSYFASGATGGVPSTETEARAQAIKQIVDLVQTRTFDGW